MIRRIVLTALVLVGALLTGCASGPRFSEVSSSILPIPAAEGRIYFFRSSSMMGAAFFYLDRPAGTYTASTTTEVEKTTTFTLAVGETRYLRTSISMGLLVGHVAVEVEEPQKAMAEIQTLSLTGSVVTGASAAPPTTVAASVRDPEVAAADRPARTRHLDAAMLEGRSWTFPHPRDPARYGDVHISFANGIATANNSRSRSAGPFNVTDDKVCIDFQSHDWAHTCYYVVDSDPAATGASGPMVWTVFTHIGVPLTIQ